MITRPLVILGSGRIARALLRQLLERGEHLRRRHGIDLPIAAVATTRFLAAGEPYLSAEQVAGVAGHGLEGLEGIEMVSAAGPDPAVRQLDYIGQLARADARAVVVDLTASEQTSAVLLAALDAGFDVVMANKKPLSGNYATFLALTQHPRGRIGFEATVGAGLPIVQTLRTLVDTGDQLIDLTACLSGTLGYVCAELEDGRPLSAIVREARERGYTEPDPRDDLSGDDVRRKALILARIMGLQLELDDVPAAPLIPLEHGSLDEWMESLPRHDAALAARVRAAHEQGDVLRYVARILPDRCEVGLRAVPRHAAVGRLRGTDNILTARTRFYDDRPLVISGPGAGSEVTAAGIFGDLLRLAGTA